MAHLNMECAPNINIFRELQVVLDTGYFSGQISPEEDWQQVRFHIKIYKYPHHKLFNEYLQILSSNV